MESLPECGVMVVKEGTTTRLFFDFQKKVSEEEGGADDLYYCESVDVQGTGYGDIVSAIVNDRYSADDIQAIVSNHIMAIDANSDVTEEKREEYLREEQSFREWRKHSKEIARIVIEVL